VKLSVTGAPRTSSRPRPRRLRQRSFRDRRHGRHHEREHLHDIRQGAPLDGCFRHPHEQRLRRTGQRDRNEPDCWALWAGWTKKVVDPQGCTVLESAYRAGEGSSTMADHTVFTSYDQMGRESSRNTRSRAPLRVATTRLATRPRGGLPGIWVETHAYDAEGHETSSTSPATALRPSRPTSQTAPSGR